MDLAFPLTSGQLKFVLGAIVVAGLWMIGINFLIAFRMGLPKFIVVQFNMDSESVLGAWYPSALLWGVSVLSLVNFNLDRLEGVGRLAYGWAGIGLVALFLSADEVAMIHERIGLEFWNEYGSVPFLPRTYAWVLVLAPFILGTVVFYVQFFRRRFRQLRVYRRLALLGIASWLNAVAFESLANSLFTPETVAIEQAIEESSELIGTTLFLLVFAAMAAARSKRLRSA